jgi:tetratricopeptide (TPR) repeat protein/arylsulfatase A-like enzyme
MDTVTRRRVLLIGWDAADWKVINPLIDAGKMPHLAALLEGGICGNLATLQPVLSPMLWTSIATGKRPYKHGIHGFSEPDPVTGDIRPVTNLSRKTKALWNILNQNGLKSVTIGWWPSHPAEELSRGVMVSNDYQRAQGHDPANWPMKPGTVHPKKLEEVLSDCRVHPASLSEARIRAFLPGLEGMSREDLDLAEKDPRVQSLLKIVADASTIHAAAKLLIHAPWDFMGVYYDAIDHFGHAFMKYHPPRRDHINEWDFRVFGACLEAGYLLHDEMLGELLALAGDEVTVIVMSDHGFHPDHLRPRSIPREPAGPAVEHRQFGIFAARGPGLRRDERLYGANVLDLCPTVLHLFGLPVGEDMDGKVLLDLYGSEPSPVERVPSWDEVPGDHGMHARDRQISAADSKAALDQLVALGYIDKPDEDRAKAIEQTVRELDYNLALAQLDGGLYREAITRLEALCATWPMEHRFGYYLAIGYQRTARPAELREVISRLIERRLAEAEEAAKELASIRAEKTPPSVAEGSFTNVEKEPAHVARIRELLAKANPNLFSLRYLESFADFAEKKYEAALDRLGQLDSDFGSRLSGLVLRGEILQRLQRWEESRTAFEEALAIDPETPAALIGIARTDLAQRRFESAAACARASLGLLFFQPRAHYLHGLALYRLGAWEDAENAFRLCVTQAPLFASAHRMLAEIARRHRRDPALSASLRGHFMEVMKRRRELRTRTSEAIPAAHRSLHDAAPLPELKSDPGALAAMPARDLITVVTGLPRTGTSLMMQILEAAGLPLFTDGERTADESNERGYYEHRQIGSLLNRGDQDWLGEARGRAVKVVAPLLASLPGHLPDPLQGDNEPYPVHYRVLFMERDMDEILASQSSFLGRRGEKVPAEGQGDIAKAYLQQLRNARQWCQHPEVHGLAVSYETLVNRPAEILPEIAAFLGVTDRLEAMRACIDPALYRERKP